MGMGRTVFREHPARQAARAREMLIDLGAVEQRDLLRFARRC